MKTLAEKMEEMAEKGKTAKIIKIAETSKKRDERIAAISAMRLLKEEATIRSLIENLIKEEDVEIRKAVATALDRIATKRETDKLMHLSNNEGEADIAEILRIAAINSKERTPRW
ncbi:MAG: HEAT repeat domain-containing protein [Oscillospiraceae bacterium]|nr:HEAT repeat domain-containing protein [Oscillospiraceae bacterium]